LFAERPAGQPANGRRRKGTGVVLVRRQETALERQEQEPGAAVPERWPRTNLEVGSPEEADKTENLLRSKKAAQIRP